jgi:hypothetical protein
VIEGLKAGIVDTFTILSDLSIMPLDSFPQINLGTAVLIIFALCAGFVLLRGMVRMVVGTLVIGGSATLAWWVWSNSPLWLFETTGKAPTWAAPTLAGLTFLAAWWLLAKAVRFFVRPGGSGKPTTFVGALGRMVFALVPTSLLGLVSAVFFHHNESSESRAQRSASSPPPPLMTRLSESLESAIPKPWLEQLNPLANQTRVDLAQAITAQAQTPRAPVIDPSTGKPVPRAVVVNDPELQTLAREGKFSKLLRHPNLTKALADPKIQKRIQDIHP